MAGKAASAGLLVWRRRDSGLEFFLVHPGGPFWARKDDGAWSIPKGEIHPGENMLQAAKREMREETGLSVRGTFRRQPPVRQRGGKIVHAWAVEADLDPADMKPGMFEMEWPPRSGRKAAFPEIDRGAWFGVDEALKKILISQQPILLNFLQHPSSELKQLSSRD